MSGVDYEVTEPFGYTTTDWTGAAIELHWEKGKVSPKNESEETGLELGVSLGYAKRLKSKAGD